MIPFARNTFPVAQVITIGSTKQIKIIPAHWKAPASYPFGSCDHPVMIQIGPTSPEVPIAGPLFLIRNTQVERAPVTAAVMVGGIHSTGFFIRFGT